jgi:hypothetical protein
MASDNRRTARGSSRDSKDPWSVLSPQQLLFYNEHPAALLRDVPEEARARVLRQVEREVERLEAQQTAEQRAWLRAAKPNQGLNPLRVARAATFGLPH